MAQITKSVQVAHGMLPQLIAPTTVAKISQEELWDRLAFVVKMNTEADQASNHVLASCYRAISKAALTAAPRDEVEQQARGYRAKAALLGPGLGDHLLRMADDLERRNPVAPRRTAVRKAQADPVLMPVYDIAGKLIGAVDEAEVIPVTDAEIVAKAASAGMTAVFDDQGKAVGFTHPDAVKPLGAVTVSAGGTTGLGPPRNAPQKALPGDVVDRQVIKAAPAPKVSTPEQVIKSFGPQWMPVYDWTGHLAGAVPRSHVTALAAGQVLKGAAASSRANVYDARRRRVGTAPLAAIVGLADLPGPGRR
jgi:hypothetical protein